ncbi:MAG: DUF4242 domain-containing protein [Bacteroidales bacterium]|nr:DUF4242 domain-containing protein [Bacteroidales bacterium]
MPIYMDRHNVAETVTAEIVAHLHQQDLKVQHQFNCRALTYWFDELRKTAFCLIEAPGSENIEEMHKHAHGQVPHEIIEVDATLVESFLGRIEDPAGNHDTDLNIIRDAAFRTILVVKYRFPLMEENNKASLKNKDAFEAYAIKLINQYKGAIILQGHNDLLLSFKSVSHAVNCAVELQNHTIDLCEELNESGPILNIGVCGGMPVTGNKAMFETTITTASRLCDFAEKKIMVTSEVNDLYRNENPGESIDYQYVKVLTPSDEQFVSKFMGFLESEYQNEELRVGHFNMPLAYSKSKLYRKMMDLSGLSPAAFLKDYRLNKALAFINKQQNNISEIAFDTGFSSLSYFSKCFRKRYGIIPSDYVRSMSR